MYVVYVKVKISKLKNIIKEEIKSLKEQGYPWDPLEPGDPSYDTSYLCPNGGDLAGTGLSNLDNTNSVYHSNSISDANWVIYNNSRLF